MSVGVGAVGERIRIGVSSCLLGHAVRYDGGHRRDGFLVETFGRYVEWVPVCPEVELGLGVPRPTLRLQGGAAGGGVRLVMPSTGEDYTEAMQAYALRRVAGLAADGLCGYVCKRNSPSCGPQRVLVYPPVGAPRRVGRGLFVAALLERVVHLPIEDEARLTDPMRREHFIERVFAYQRLRVCFGPRWTVAGLRAFHARHVLQVMAHVPAAVTALGRVVADATTAPRGVTRERYAAGFMGALRVRATSGRHARVLRHVLAGLRPHLDRGISRELVTLVEDYRQGHVPFVVPLTLVRHHARRLDVPALRGQVYLEPHPSELLLRNHA